MFNRVKIAGCAVAAAMLLAPSMAPAAGVVVMSTGTMVDATMNQTIDSGSAQVGQTFTMNVVPPLPQGNPAYSGATLYGHVTQVAAAGQGTKPELAFAIDKITLPNGDVGHPILMVQSQQTQQHSNATRLVAGAAAGMLLGNWVGKAVFSSNAGGAVGLFAGALYASNMHTNVSLRQGSEVVFEAQQSVALR